MFHVKPMRNEDFPFAVTLSNTMDWNNDLEDFKFISSLEPHGCFVAYKDSKPVGIATCISHGKVGWFGNLIVKEEFRGEGVGSLLVKHAVNYLQSRGVEAIGLYTYSDLKRFYEKLGFKFDSNFTFLQLKKSPLVFSEKAPKTKKQFFPALIKFDSEYFGASREKLLKAIFSGKNNLCYFSSDEDKINGYVAAKICGETAEIGPLICQSNKASTAKMLLRTVLSQLKGYNVSLCLQSKETEIASFLRENDFSESVSLLRMFLGAYTTKDCIYVAESVERG